MNLGDSDAAGSVNTSQLQGPWFVPELTLMFM